MGLKIDILHVIITIRECSLSMAWEGFEIEGGGAKQLTLSKWGEGKIYDSDNDQSSRYFWIGQTWL